MEELISQLKNLRYVVEEIVTDIKSRHNPYQGLVDVDVLRKSEFIDEPIYNMLKKLLDLESRIDKKIKYSESEIEQLLNDIEEVQLHLNINFYHRLQFF